MNDLLVGTYEVKETEAPHGYLLNTDTFTVKVEKDKTTVLRVLQMMNLKEILISKKKSILLKQMV